ncbi:hypothetical protein JCM10213_001454 [Rhodosporidiobolus nylandii]
MSLSSTSPSPVEGDDAPPSKPLSRQLWTVSASTAHWTAEAMRTQTRHKWMAGPLAVAAYSVDAKTTTDGNGGGTVTSSFEVLLKVSAPGEPEQLGAYDKVFSRLVRRYGITVKGTIGRHGRKSVELYGEFAAEEVCAGPLNVEVWHDDFKTLTFANTADKKHQVAIELRFRPRNVSLSEHVDALYPIGRTIHTPLPTFFLPYRTVIDTLLAKSPSDFYLCADGEEVATHADVLHLFSEQQEQGAADDLSRDRESSAGDGAEEEEEGRGEPPAKRARVGSSDPDARSQRSTSPSRESGDVKPSRNEADHPAAARLTVSLALSFPLFGLLGVDQMEYGPDGPTSKLLAVVNHFASGTAAADQVYRDLEGKLTPEGVIRALVSRDAYDIPPYRALLFEYMKHNFAAKIRHLDDWQVLREMKKTGEVLELWGMLCQELGEVIFASRVPLLPALPW